MAGPSGALSIKPSEGSRSRVRRARPMDFQSIFAWKSLPEAGFGKNVVIDADPCSGSGLTWVILTRGGLLFKAGVQTTVSNACISYALASAARAASF